MVALFAGSKISDLDRSKGPKVPLRAMDCDLGLAKMGLQIIRL